MNILDENVPESQRVLLRSRRVAVRQIGRDLGWKGMKDREIIPLLHELDRPTLFTLDRDFYDRRLCHEGYCLVYLDIYDELVAEFTRRVLRLRELNTKAKRMGHIVWVSPTGVVLWRVRQSQEGHLSWP